MLRNNDCSTGLSWKASGGSLREKCPYTEFFWSVFSRIRTEYGEIRSVSPYSVRMRENTGQENSEHFFYLFIDIILSQYSEKQLKITNQDGLPPPFYIVTNYKSSNSIFIF